MIAVFGLAVMLAAVLAAFVVAPFDSGQKWVKNAGIAIGLSFFGGGVAFAGSLLFWLGEFLLNHAP